MSKYTDSIKNIPKPAMWLGIGGVLPFIFFDAYVLFGPPEWVQDVLDTMVGYGAVILSFLGGVLWGFALTHEKGVREGELTSLLVVSVFPPLIGWVALFVEPITGIVLMVVSFLGLLLVDWRFYRAGHSRNWYMGLRTLLTLCVVLCLGVAWVAA
ncbi:MAG: DUF3429 domain-containing protein [Magnetovibrio sp.]|nr:DUF3429 domain-containing protein [Magnetovibrio sp.]